MKIFAITILFTSIAILSSQASACNYDKLSEKTQKRCERAENICHSKFPVGCGAAKGVCGVSMFALSKCDN